MSESAYGSDPTETIDLFFPPGPRSHLPVHMFIHGGYWRMFSKRDYSYVADTIVGAGAIAAVVDYALMPNVRLAKIVDQVRRAKNWILDWIRENGGDPDRLTVSGHSAGAHLATFLFLLEDGPPHIGGAMLLGGLYDLKPLQTSFLQHEIGLTDAEVARYTPLLRRHDPEVPVSVVVGAEETPPFHHQGRAFTTVLRQQGSVVSTASLANANHMSSVRDLGVVGTPASDLLVRMIREP